MHLAGYNPVLGTVALAVSLGLPAVNALAVSTANTNVTIRDTQSLSRDFGRDGTDVYWDERSPTTPPAPIVKAYNASKDFVMGEYQDAKTIMAQKPQPQPAERYGRAGGYVGLDVLRSPLLSKAPGG